MNVHIFKYYESTSVITCAELTVYKTVNNQLVQQYFLGEENIFIFIAIFIKWSILKHSYHLILFIFKYFLVIPFCVITFQKTVKV